ncbi:MAG: N-acetylmuramoyl-L-alanine amidase [Acidimicrobiia bacterium]
MVAHIPGVRLAVSDLELAGDSDVKSLFALAMALTLATLPPGGSFLDDDGSVHEGNIEAIYAAGITTGCNPPESNRFCPDDTVTRGQMAAFISRSLGLPATDVDYFTDDDGTLFEGAIDRIAQEGVTVGCNPPANDHFCPDRPMSRGEMAAMLARAFDYPGSAVDHFTDDDGTLFEAAIDRIADAGVTLGCNPPANDHFCPFLPVTRAEMATFLTRALGLTSNPPPPRPVPAVVVQGREAWGARPADTGRLIPHTITRITIHHAGTQTGVTGPAQFRGWQNWHMDGQGWPDIAYHLLIGIDGTVYEGRDPAYRGDTGTSYDTTGHFLVVVEGNFEVEQPTAAQIQSLERVVAWAVETYDVPLSHIAGHRDYAATSCPGKYLEGRITSGALQAAVQDLLDQGGVDLIWP